MRRSARISPSIQRVVLGGRALADLALPSPGGHVKLRLPGGVMRTYTPRHLDLVTRELTIDLALHGDGPATRWAREAQPGDAIGVAGPGRGYDPDPDASRFLLAGDETAIAAIVGIAAALPDSAEATVLVEVPDAADSQQLVGPASLDVRWLARRGEPVGARLEPALHALDIAPDARAWMATEAGLVRRLRRHLLEDRGLPAAHVVARGYWKLGEADHPDHDYAD